jgi:aspartate 1-decarboxylase
MQRQMLKSKIHRATVTGCDPDYVGSITLDPELMQSADMIPNEQVHVWDIENGARFVTYAVAGEPGSRTVHLNGAAARLVSEGDMVIVASFAAYGERDLKAYSPVVVHVDERNAIARVDSHPEVLLGSPLASDAHANGGDLLGFTPAAAGLSAGLDAGEVCR